MQLRSWREARLDCAGVNNAAAQLARMQLTRMQPARIQEECNLPECSSDARLDSARMQNTAKLRQQADRQLGWDWAGLGWDWAGLGLDWAGLDWAGPTCAAQGLDSICWTVAGCRNARNITMTDVLKGCAERMCPKKLSGLPKQT